MSDVVRELVRKKTTAYEVVARYFDIDGMPWVSIQPQGTINVFRVPWARFNEEYEAAGLTPAKPATEERCRRGEWVPGRFIGMPGVCFACCAEVIDADDRVRVRPCSVNGLGQSELIDVSTWDAARAQWIAEGRPT
jgi:hypothetical protein